MNELTTIYVATDLSKRADEAIVQGHAWAQRYKASLVVGHIVPSVVGVNVLFPERTHEQLGVQLTLVERARRTVIDRVQALTGRAINDFVVDVVTGEPDQKILAAAVAQGASMIVIGDSGAGVLSRNLFGRTVAKVLRGAHVPVMIARPSKQAGPTIAATDFSDPATPALRAGVLDAQSRGAPLVLFHALDFVAMPPYGYASLGTALGVSPIMASDEMINAAKARLQDTARELGVEGADLRVGVAGAASQIVTLADELSAELVVVGTHGRSGFGRIAMGSVAESVAMNASCSVLVVRLKA